MKLVCVDNSKYDDDDSLPQTFLVKVCQSLTIGNIYESLNDESQWESIGIFVRNDNEDRYYYRISRFRKLDDVREDKLKELLGN